MSLGLTKEDVTDLRFFGDKLEDAVAFKSSDGTTDKRKESPEEDEEAEAIALLGCSRREEDDKGAAIVLMGVGTDRGLVAECAGMLGEEEVVVVVVVPCFHRVNEQGTKPHTDAQRINFARTKSTIFWYYDH